MIHTSSFRTTTVISIFLVALLIGSCASGQRTQKPTTRKYPRNELLIMYSDRFQESDRQYLRDSVRKTGKVRDFKVMKCACDENLELWVGGDIVELLDDSALIKGEVRPVSRGGVTEDTLYLSPNFNSSVPGVQRTKMRPMPPVISRNLKEVKIAVLDTGLDPICFTEEAKRTFLFRNNELPFVCTTGAPESYAGWNFVAGNSNVADNYPGRHGTNITGLILAEGTLNKLRILPLKTHGSNGMASLFNLMCGMKFARKAQMDYVNASWGAYGAENVIFSRVLRELEGSKIGFIAAAGNEGKDIGDPNFWFYPARYSEETPLAHSNIISVTTVTPTGRCAHNYSQRHVDLGVMGNDENCLFTSVFQNGTALKISGSSFATAVMTGIIANNHPYQGNGNLKTRIIMSSVLTPVSTTVDDTRTRKGFRQNRF